MAMTVSLTHRALAVLPRELQALARAHVQRCPADDLGELISEIFLAIATAKAGEPLVRTFERARSNLRRETQDPARYGAGLDDQLAATASAPKQENKKKSEVVREVAARRAVSERYGRKLVARQLSRARAGDLFFDLPKKPNQKKTDGDDAPVPSEK